MMSSEKTNNSGVISVKSMALIPTVVIGGAGAGLLAWPPARPRRRPRFRASLREHRGGQRLEAAVLQRS